MATRIPPAGTKQDTRIIDRLLSEGKVDQAQREAVCNHMRLTGERQEESIIETEALPEAELLKYLAALHKTRFVSTDRLSKANIDKTILFKIPKKMAERFGVVPVLFDAPTNCLSIVTADPDNVEVLNEIQNVARVREVKALVGRPAAVRAAVDKLYFGNVRAFLTLERGQPESGSKLEVFGKVSPSPIPLSTTGEGRATWAVESRSMYAHDRLTAMPGQAIPQVASLPREFVRDERTESRRGDVESSDTMRAAEPIDATLTDSFLEVSHVLVGLLENARPDLKGHSSQVSKLVRRLAERMGLSKAEVTSAALAGLLHDLGKMGSYHLTPLNVAQYEPYRQVATKSYQTPRKLLEEAHLSPITIAAVEGMYERYDGQGMPGSRTGRDIPLGARMLAIADVFADLTQNVRNPFRKLLRASEACDVLAKYKGSIFDPQLVDVFRAAVAGDDQRDRALATRNVVLLVDPDPEDTTLLELRMVEEGLDVRVARSVDQAMRQLQAGDVELVVAELDIGKEDGFALLEEARSLAGGEKLPWLILTRRQGRAEAQRGFEFGIVDYVIKPAATEVLVAKVKQALEKRKGLQTGPGISGSLAEMSLPDLVQVLWHGRKSGVLNVRRGRDAGEIHFQDGAIVHALWGKLTAEEAFYAMIPLNEGQFSLDPNTKPQATAIRVSPEALLLEAMRRIDESDRSVG